MKTPSTKLSVNVNKLATLRNARGGNNPDLAAWSKKILDLGADGITVHPRPDARHIRFEDVRTLAVLVKQYGRGAEFNVEGYPSPDFLALVEETRPDQATLVPDPPDAITSNAGWDLKAHEDELRQVIQRLAAIKVRTSLFIDPQNLDSSQREVLRRLKPARVELYTERFAHAHGTPLAGSITAEYGEAARFARDLNVGVNAGHDLNQKNLGALIAAISFIDEVSIGHALICEALEDGMAQTIRAYQDALRSVHARD